MTSIQDAWPAGATWVFQGTVAEDATAGTHVSSLTVVPGAGNEFWFLYGDFIAGNGAANLISFQIRDAATGNIITRLCPGGLSLAANQVYSFPNTGQGVAGQQANGVFPFLMSGTMALYMQVSTATVSLTHTFAVACRLKTSALPTATLADTVGTPTLTVNTNRVF